jgi:hypothetical protein
VTANFGIVEYFPNLKSKIGFASNASEAALSTAGTALNDIGPGIMCSNIEFDFAYKHPGEPNAPLVTIPGTPNQLQPTPSPWLGTYENMLGDLNISQLEQITGAPEQYLPDMNKAVNIRALHQAPTNIPAASALTASWTSGPKHTYPIMWSFWNEPVHTFMGLDITKNVAGYPVYPNESKDDFANRVTATQGTSSTKFGQLYGTYETVMRPVMHKFGQMGLASFLAADFNPTKLTPTGNTYAKQVLDSVGTSYPRSKVDFLTFNNFNGGWPVSLSGARAMLYSNNNTNINTVPLILTQYSPSSLKVADDGSVSDFSVNPMQVATNMLTDLTGFERATDLRSACMSYWSGGQFGFVSLSDTAAPVPQIRYNVMKLFAELPIVRTRINFGSTGLEAKNIHALGGVNNAKASVLLWNDSSTSATVPLTLGQLPDRIKNSNPTISLRTISAANPTVTTMPTSQNVNDTETISLPAFSVALIEVTASNQSNPLTRRNSLVPTGGNRARFLQTKSFTDRTSTPCTDLTTIPNIPTCAKNTGTYGFYDSVRSVAYLGHGDGTKNAVVTATYDNLPSKVYVNTNLFTFTGDTNQKPVTITANYTLPSCVVFNKTVTPTLSATSTGSYQTINLASTSAACARTPITFTFTLASATPVGTQAEVFLSANEADAQKIAAGSVDRFVPGASIRVDVNENLVVTPFFAADRDTPKVIAETLPGRINWGTSTTPCGDNSCRPGRPFTLPVSITAVDDKVTPAVELVPRVNIPFTPDQNGSFRVRAPRGAYRFAAADSSITCTVTDNRVGGSVAHDDLVFFTTGVMYNVTATCLRK